MIEQIFLAVTGIIAIYLTQQQNEKYKKYAPIFGLLGQPVWFYVTYSSEQYGMFILSVFYTLIWVLGFYNYWIKKQNVNL